MMLLTFPVMTWFVGVFGSGLADHEAHALLQLRSRSDLDVQVNQNLVHEITASHVGQSSKAELHLAYKQGVEQPQEPRKVKKVIKMIKDLISKLMQEATEEAEQKGWCDTEVTTNTQTRNKKTEEVNTLTSEIEDLTATIAQLTPDISDLTAQLKGLASAMADATKKRGTNKAKNEQTISNARAAQTSVKKAMAVLKRAVLKNSYAEATASEFAYELPETLSRFSRLESEFSRLESETTAEESAESEEYKAYKFEAEKDQALKMNEKKHKEQKKVDKESALSSAEAELKLTQEALDKAVANYEKLKQTCVDTGISYEERVKRREAEMQSLQEALKILSGTDVDVA